MRSATRVLHLTAYERLALPSSALSGKEGATLAQLYGAQVQVEPPSFLNAEQWHLTAQGWAGYLPVTPDLRVVLHPRVPLHNVFTMLVYAHDLGNFQFLDGPMVPASLAGFYERLAEVLAQSVLARARRGFHRAYEARQGTLPFVAGRLDVDRLASRPWMAGVPCDYQTHTTDIEDNQILAWSLHEILRTELCEGATLSRVRRAYRAACSAVKLRPSTAEACAGRNYTRLNEDYRPMHALCRFFLAHGGPSSCVGEELLLPFLVHMGLLYERFVAGWLTRHLPSSLRLVRQERVTLASTAPTSADGIHFDIDLTLYDRQTEQVLTVLDTKYKTPERASTDDIAQVVAYAEAQGCHEAILIYPQPLSRPLDLFVGDIHVRTLTFGTEGDLDAAGMVFMDEWAPVSAAAQAGVDPRDPTVIADQSS